MLSPDIVKVALVETPKNWAKTQSSNNSTQQQIIQTTQPAGSLFIVDSKNSVPETKYMVIKTGNIFEHYSKLRLSNAEITLDLPTINQFNKRVRLFVKKEADITVYTIEFDLVEGYYAFGADFLAMFETRMNGAFTPAIGFDPATALAPFSAGLYCKAERASTATTSSDYHKMRLTMCNSATVNFWEFVFDETCPFLTAKFLCYFDTTGVPLFANATGSGIQGTIVSNVATMVHSRFLYVVSPELASNQPVPSYDGEKTVHSLISVINLDQLSEPVYASVSQNIDSAIDVRGVALDRIHLRVLDEWGNIIPFGFEETNLLDLRGKFLDNQIRLTFICHP